MADLFNKIAGAAEAIDWTAIVKTVAPTLATALGGPLAGMATTAISTALLGKPDGTMTEVAAVVAGATPDQLLVLKKADQDFAVKMKELDIEIEKVNAEDRSSARKREVETKDKTPKVLAFMIVVGFMATAIGVLSGYAKVESVLAGTIIGYISAKAELVLTYYFGSSAGSDRKTEIMNQNTKK